MRYWARPGAIDHGHASYAESVGKHMFDFLETYFDAPFRLPKLGRYNGSTQKFDFFAVNC